MQSLTRSGLVMFFAVLFWPGTARAAEGDCIPKTVKPWFDPTVGYNYRVSLDGAQNLDGVGESEFIEAAIAAGDTWNEQANGGYFRFKGTTQLTDLVGVDCNLGYSIIVVTDELSDESCSNADVTPVCQDVATGTFKQFVLRIRTRMNELDEWPYSVGNVDNSCSTSYNFFETCPWNQGNNEWHPSGFTFCETDLQQVITHELGHTLNMAHPTDFLEDSIMLTTRWNSTSQRDLYQYDKKCAREVAGQGKAHAYRRYVSGGAVGSEVQRSSSSEWPVRSHATGIWKHGSTWKWSYAYSRYDDFRFRYYNPPWRINRIDTTDSRDSSGTLALFREYSEQNSRLLFVEDWDDPVAYDFDSTFRVRYERSSDGHYGTDGSGSMKVCNSMTGFLACSSTSWMHSPYPVSVAYDNDENRSVTAWVNYNRQDDSEDRLLQISVGFMPNRTLPTPDDFGVKSSVGPAVACEDGASGDDCLVAYVDMADSLGRIRVIRFHNDQTSTGYDSVKSGGPYYVASSDARTAQRIALFRHDSKWWLVYRSKRADQELSVYTATHPWSWTFYGNVGYSITGPTAVSYWTGNNMIGTTRN